jgi:hypothetical protein
MVDVTNNAMAALNVRKVASVWLSSYMEGTERDVSLPIANDLPNEITRNGSQTIMPLGSKLRS